MTRLTGRCACGVALHLVAEDQEAHAECATDGSLCSDAIGYQVDAFVAYALRGGRLSLEEWMETKDFAPSDRAAIRSVWTRAAREAS